MKKSSKASHKLFKATLATTVAAGAFVAAVPMVTNAAVSFKDVKPGVHYYEPVLELAGRGVVKGYDDGTYRPNASVTRAQSAKILAHVLDLDTTNVKDPGFSDVKKGTPYYGPIAALAQAGYIKGYEENGVKSFKPNDNLKRSQMAKILTLGFDLEESALAADRFKDVKPTDAYAGYVAALLALDITTGTTPTTFAPNGLVTRGQMATFVVRTEVALKEETPEVPETPNPEQPEVPETPNPEQPEDPTPPVDPTGEQLLQNSIQTELSKVNTKSDAIAISFTGSTFNVEIKKPESTVNDFSVVAKPIFDAMKKNTIINSATVSVVIGGQEIAFTETDIDNSQDFDAVLNKALAKVGLTSDSTLAILKGRTVSLNVKGSIESKSFNSTYQFKF
ncbi:MULTISPECIES: S-layer homology domain-containing protein [unclassified Sporosarcina]|uniref:S-layer homology domain-containing protein n=1 Tax=unclassified Sporosarcina TaxID=2647733 RepID=UPI001303FAB9|nr:MULTISPECIES: S-layer homology domain-containing protein [unclassified Sporosarcina]